MREVIVEAATILLVRDRVVESGNGRRLLEVYLTKRPSTMRFLADHDVYPGGQMDGPDLDEAWAELCSVIPTRQNPEQLALSYGVTALRETFEEVGILLARDRSGQLVPQERTIEWRERMLAGQVSFLELIQANRWTLATDLLRTFGHRLTPRKVSRKRFSTCFFMTILPEGMVPYPHEDEVVSAAWYEPLTALRLWEAGELLLVPPTVDSLRVMERYVSAEDLWQSTEGVGTPTPEELE